MASSSATCPDQVVLADVDQGAGLAPMYLTDLCQPVTSAGSLQRLRSATRGDLVTRPMSTYFGARSFAVAGPTACNQLLADVCSTE